MSRKALGRGLGALIGEQQETVQGLVEIDIDLIRPNPHQPRHSFENEKLAELAASLKLTGVLQPIVVRRVEDKYEIIAGERRWRAAGLAGLSKIPAILRDLPDEKLLESSLVENIQRENLNPIEEARAYRSLISDLGLTQEQIALRVGRDRSSVTNYLRLLKLPEDVKRLVETGKITMGHARALLTLPDPKDQSRLANDILIKGLSVRDTERAVAKVGQSRAGQKVVSIPIGGALDPNIRAAEERLRKRLSTVVRIVPSTRGGRIEIQYHSEEDLHRLFELLMGKPRDGSSR